jgi:hypothetical protein
MLANDEKQALKKLLFHIYQKHIRLYLIYWIFFFEVFRTPTGGFKPNVSFQFSARQASRKSIGLNVEVYPYLFQVCAGF